MRAYSLLLVAVIVSSVFLSAPLRVSGAESAGYGTGFVEKAIWYSQASPKEGDTVTVYAALFNAHPETLSGMVVFYDRTVIISKKPVSVPGNGAAVVSTEWNVTAGTHLIRAEMLDPVVVSGGKESRVFLDDAKASGEEFSVKKSVAPLGETTVAADEEKTTDKESADALGRASAGVMGPITKAAQTVDAWRSGTAETLSKKEEAAKEELALLKDEPGVTATIEDGGVKVAPTKDAAKTPLAHIRAFFYTLAAYVFGHKVLFYLLAGGVIFLVIRSLWKRAA